MSTNRSSSGVRNLRAMFENKDDDAPASRSRSPAGSNASENRRTSKVRASFVSVEPSTSQMDTEVPLSASARRESFSLSESQDSDKIAELRTTVSQEKEERKQSKAAETIPESAIESTPSTSPAIRPRKEKAMGSFVNDGGASPKNTTPASHDTPGANPDKRISAVEETPVAMRPTDPKDESVISGEPLPPPSEPVSKPLTNASQGRSPLKKASSPGTSSKVSPVKDKLGVKQNGTAGVKAHAPTKTAEAKPAGKPTSSRPPTASTKASATAKPSGHITTPKSPSAKQTRTSLESIKSTTSSRSSTATRPTAASAAKKAESTSTSGEATKSKPQTRSPTRPIKLPSHLTAATASSAAKHGEAPSTTSTATRKPAPRQSTGPAKPAAVRREAPRQSMPAPATAKRPESRTSTRGPEDSFLARMMRPTASSANKTAEKTEVKSPPPKRSGSVRTKASTQSLAGKAKKAVSAALKDKEPQQNGATAHHEDLHEGEMSVAAEDTTITEAAHEPPEELADVLEASKPEVVSESALESPPESPPHKPIHQPMEEPTKDAIPEPPSEPLQPPVEEPALETAPEPTPEPSNAPTTKPTEATFNDTEQEGSQDPPSTIANEVEKGSEGSEKDMEPKMESTPELQAESTPEHTRTADVTLEQTPAFDGASIR